MRSESQKKADKKYNAKIRNYKVGFTTSPEEQEIADKLDALIAASGKSVNQYLKDLLAEHVSRS